MDYYRAIVYEIIAQCQTLDEIQRLAFRFPYLTNDMYFQHQTKHLRIKEIYNWLRREEEKSQDTIADLMEVMKAQVTHQTGDTYIDRETPSTSQESAPSGIRGQPGMLIPKSEDTQPPHPLGVNTNHAHLQLGEELTDELLNWHIQ